MDDETMLVFEVKATSHYLDGHFFTESIHPVHDDILGHLDGLTLMRLGQSRTITIVDEDGETTTITIRRVEMERKELDEMPEWDGY